MNNNNNKNISNNSINNTRPPLLPWSKQTWERWASIPRLHKTPIPRTKFLLLKAPVSTLYEEKYLDRNVFTVSMYASRMTSLGTSVGMVIDCTAFDLQSFAPLPPKASSSSSSSTSSSLSTSSTNIRYFHDVKEWQEFDIEYIRLVPSSTSSIHSTTTTTSSSTIESSSHDTCIPTQESIQQFLQICSQFWLQNPDAYISVFDSRGGYGIASYMICSYMCVHLKASVHAALASIENTLSTMTGTGGLFDLKLMEDLQTRYHGTREICFDSSKLPTWWWIEEKTCSTTTTTTTTNDTEGLLNSKETHESIIRIIPPAPLLSITTESKNTTAIGVKKGYSDSNHNNKNHHHHHHHQQLDYVPTKRVRQEEINIPALELVPVDSTLYQRAKTVLEQLLVAKNPTIEENFYPLLLTSSNITQLYSLNQKYKISWISKGRQGLLLILTDNIFFIEVLSKDSLVDYTVSLLKGKCMNFPLPDDATTTTTLTTSSHGKKPQQQQHRTLLDVVLVKDIEDSTTNKIQYRFMIRDILAHHGGIVSNKPFQQRLKYIMEGIIQPRKRDTTFDYNNQEPIRLRAYEYFDIDRVEYVLSEVVPRQCHEAQGILLIPVDGLYHDNNKKTLCWMLDSALSKNDLIHQITGKVG